MANSDAQMQQEKNDAKLAQQLQNAEQGQAPVVVGVPIGTAPGFVGAAPGFVAGGGAGMPPFADVIIGATLPPEELLVLRYRFSMLCFATIDIFSTALDAVTGFARAFRLHEAHADGVAIEATVAALALVFLAGPICGVMGARRLKQRLVAVYLAFCIVKTLFHILLAITSRYLWFIIVALVYVWITKIVYTFWSSLRKIPAQRRAQLRDPQTAQGSEIGFAYW